MYKTGDLVNFSGMYIISRPGKSEVVMSVILRKGIITQISKGYVYVLSEGQMCFMTTERSGSIIEVISSSNNDS